MLSRRVSSYFSNDSSIGKLNILTTQNWGKEFGGRKFRKQAPEKSSRNSSSSSSSQYSEWEGKSWYCQTTDCLSGMIWNRDLPLYGKIRRLPLTTPKALTDLGMRKRKQLSERRFARPNSNSTRSRITRRKFTELLVPLTIKNQKLHLVCLRPSKVYCKLKENQTNNFFFLKLWMNQTSPETSSTSEPVTKKRSKTGHTGPMYGKVYGRNCRETQIGFREKPNREGWASKKITVGEKSRKVKKNPIC